MTNAIYEKSRTKRKYHRLPPCGHRNQICDMEHCRLQYAIKIPKDTSKIDEYLHHREKVIKRRREVDLQRLDSEIKDELIPMTYDYIGEYRKRKELKAKYRRMAWIALFIFLGLVLLASLIM